MRLINVCKKVNYEKYLYTEPIYSQGCIRLYIILLR